MKTVKFILILFFLLAGKNFTHAAEVDLANICLGDNQYKFIHKVYRDYAGNNLGVNFTISLSSDSCGQNINLTVNWDSIIINNFAKPKANFTQDKDKICAAECIQFTNQSTIHFSDSIVRYYWLKNSDTIEGKSPAICFPHDGLYHRTLITESSQGYKDTIQELAHVIHKKQYCKKIMYIYQKPMKIYYYENFKAHFRNGSWLADKQIHVLNSCCCC